MIRSGTKNQICFTRRYLFKYSVHYRYPQLPAGQFSPLISSGIISLILMGTNSEITSGDFFSVPPRDFLRYQNILFLLHSTNPLLLHLPTTRYTYSIQILQPTLSQTLILPPIQYHILRSATTRSSNRSGVAYSITNKIIRTSRVNMEKNYWRKAKKNWAAAISEAQFDFMLKYD